MTTEWLPTDLLWRGALVVIPVTLLVAVVGAVFPCRPSTRHSMWLAVLGLLVVVPLLPPVAIPQLPAGPPVVSIQTPLTELARRKTEGNAPTTSVGPPASAIESGTPRRVEPHGVRVPGGLETWSGEPPEALESRSRTPLVSRRSSVDRKAVMPPVTVEPSETGRHAHARANTSSVVRDSVTTPARSEWRRWAVQLGVVRDAIVGMPPVPAAVWGGGFVLLMLVAAVRIGRSVRLIRGGRAAPPSVIRMVTETSEALGMRRAPHTLMVDAAVSPMVWCGRRACLVLPRSLWAQLDAVGRRAVICHELAHLRRRDHWVCRAEMVIGWMYWWHPVVWWVRRRLREEADLCCDNWVTTLLPYGRRAYAEALLETRRRRSATCSAVPSVGLGATTKRTKRFARRLTMVMTAQTSPSHSRKGVLLACMVALGGVMVTPLWACPKESNAQTKADKPAKPKKPFKLVVPTPPKAPVVPSAPMAPTASTTFEQFMGGLDDESLEKRMEMLERQLERLHEELRRIMRESRRGGAPHGRGGGAGVGQGALASGGMGTGLGGDRTPAPSPTTDCNEIVIRSYELPDGKAEALAKLMIRNDVPIRVRPDGDRIEVHAMDRHQRIFAAFCAMIDGEDRVKAYTLPQGKLGALTELMVRPDVPILVEPGRERIRVHGTDLEQLVFAAFVNMIHPDGKAQASAGGAQVYTEALANLANQYESRASSRVAETRAMQASRRALELQIKAFERQADGLRDKADRLREKADKLESEADDLREEAEELSGARRTAVLAKAQSLSQKAESLQEEAEALEEQAETLEDQAEAMEDEVEELEDRIEDLEDEDEDEDWDDDDDDDEDWDDAR